MALAFSNVIDIFAAPAEAYQNVKASPKWLVAFLVIVVASFIFGFIMLPFTQKIMEETLAANLTDVQTQQALSTMARYRMFLLLLVPVPLAVKWLFISLFLYLGAILFDVEQLDFKTVYAGVVYAEFILMLMGLINLIVLSFKGVGAVNNITDLNVIPGLDIFLADKSRNIPLFGLLNSFNIFSLWYVVVLTIGMSVICQLKKWKSAILVSSVWLLLVGIQFAFGQLSQNLQAMMGR